MKQAYKIIFLALLALTSYSVSAEIQVQEVLPSHVNETNQAGLQLTLFPGLARAPKTGAVLHMTEQPRDTEGVLNLNSSLTGETQQFASKQYLDDIQVTTNNILELRF